MVRLRVIDYCNAQNATFVSYVMEARREVTEQTLGEETSGIRLLQSELHSDTDGIITTGNRNTPEWRFCSINLEPPQISLLI